MKTWFGTIMFAIIVAILIIVICALPTMWLWNWLMPAIFGLGKISFWQALGINMLCSILFKSSSANRSKDN